MPNFLVSVVIPIYNAREFIVCAVESALSQPETAEVLLIDDGSTDGGLDVCSYLVQKNPKVRLLKHPGGGNLGAAASRNLGIKNAHFRFIAFLDADDFYLPNRFLKTAEVFLEHPEAEGVYEAIGTFFQDPSAERIYREVKLPMLTTVKERIEPSDLFERFMRGGVGHFSFDGFTCRSEIFQTAGCYFSEDLEMYEDSFLMYQLSAKSKLHPGSIDVPVCMRRVHDNNRITHRLKNKRKTYETMMPFWELLFKWGEKELSKKQLNFLAKKYISQVRSIDYVEDSGMVEFLDSRKKMLEIARNSPNVLSSIYFWRRFIPSSRFLSSFMRRFFSL